MPHHALSLLLVEDDDLTRESIGDFLTDNGFSVTMVGTGWDALAALRQKSFDLVVADIRLPGNLILPATRGPSCRERANRP